MDLPPISSLVLGLTAEGEPQRLSGEEGQDFVSYIGFDPLNSRLVEINCLGTESALGRHRWRSVNERLGLARRLHHPSIGLVLENGSDTEQGIYYATEFIEGEALVDYLSRLSSLPRDLGVHLALQLAEIAGYLADFPRLLATLCLDDFMVTLERERFLGLRLANLGFDRPDSPVSDAVLGAHWIETVGHLLRHLLEGAPLPAPSGLVTEAAPSGSRLDGPLGSLISRLKSEPGSVAIRELKQLKRSLLAAAGLLGENDRHLRPEFRAISEPAQRPIGSLAALVSDSPDFEELIRERWRPRNDAFAVDAASPFSLQAKTARDPSASLEDRGERVDLLLLPPERLVDGSFLPCLNRQMGDAFLKEHPYLVRTRSITCDADFTLVVGEAINGFSLMNLVTTRSHLSPAETRLILEEITRLLAHLEGSEIGLDQLDPWRLVFHFDQAAGEERIRELIAKVPLDSWPPVHARLRPVSPMESLLSPEAGSWRYLCRRLGGKPLPALVAWMMAGERFDLALGENRADSEPLNLDTRIDDLLRMAALHLEIGDPAQRQRFLELFSAIAADLEESQSRGPTLHHATHSEESVHANRNGRNGSRLRSPLSAA